MDDESNELALVYKAMCATESTSVRTNGARLSRKIRADRELDGLVPNEIPKLVKDHVRSAGIGAIKRMPNPPEDQWENEFNYQVVFPVDGFPRRLFVKSILDDDDEDCPEVLIVSAHLESPC